MAYFHITEFYYDDQSNNIIVQLSRPLPPEEYEVNPGDNPRESFEAELFLDAAIEKIGEYHPGSADGTILPVTLGRDVGQAPDTVPTHPWPPVEE